MQVCPHCGRESRAIDRFCLHCGQRLDGAVSGGDPMPLYVAVAGTNGAGPDVPPSGRSMASGRASSSATPPRPRALGRLVLQPHGSTGIREFPLDGSDIHIGRAPSCQIALPSDQLISRQHALLQYHNGQYIIKDLGSSNGTHVNGVEIHDATALNEGDRIKIGEHELVYTRTPSRNTDGFPIPVPPAWPPAVAGETSRQPAINISRPAASAAATPPGAAGAEPTSEPAPPPTDPLAARATAAPAPPPAAEVPAPTSAPSSASAPSSGPLPTPSSSGPLAAPDVPTGSAAYVEHLRDQLVAASAGLARRVEEAEREIVEMRGAVAETARRMADVLATLHPTAPEEPAAEDHADGAGADGEPASASGSSPAATHTAQLDELIAITRLAADNPRHLDYLTALATRAGDLARALQTERVAIASLEAIRARLAQLAEPPQPIQPAS